MRIDRRDYGKKLSGFMTSHELFRKEVYKRFPCIAEGPAKSVLEYAIADAADTEGVLLLVRDGAAQGKSFRATSLHTALQKVLIGTTPIESSGMQQLYSLPAHELRRNLFDILIYGNTKESKLAAECLSAIDEIRDDYGWVYSEPRHPNISTGVPWPLIDFTKPTST